MLFLFLTFLTFLLFYFFFALFQNFSLPCRWLGQFKRQQHNAFSFFLSCFGRSNYFVLCKSERKFWCFFLFQLARRHVEPSGKGAPKCGKREREREEQERERRTITAV